MKKVACIYHQHCWDGIGAAWIVRNYFDEVQVNNPVVFFPGIYQAEPNYLELAKFDTIFIVDFCYPPEILDTLSLTSDIVILDHHASAIKMLEGYSNPSVEVVFNLDNSKSGIGVTWEYFYRDIMPMPLAYIQDRDIWAWKLSETKDFTAALQQYPICMASMDEIMKERSLQSMIEEGAVINQVMHMQIEKVCATSYSTNFEGYEDIPFVNCPAFLMSEVLHDLAIGHPFAVGWYADGNTGEMKYSLRSNSHDGEDVSVIAKSYGGGGHKHAAGFVIPANHFFPTVGYFKDKHEV